VLALPGLHCGACLSTLLHRPVQAFANHCGFLQAVDDVGLPINGIMGTSAGALIGSMYAAGYTPREVGAALHLPSPGRPKTVPTGLAALSCD
jgi:hypothetical protein